MLKDLQSLVERQSGIPAATTVTAAPGTYLNEIYEYRTPINAVSLDCDGCYFIAEVVCIIAGTSLISGVNVTAQGTLRTASFSFGQYRIITPNPEPLIGLGDFSDIVVFQETIL